MPADKYRSIQNPRQYRALRRAGHSKEAAARISNAQAPGHRVKAAGYSARAGQVIAGNLARGNDGKFTSAGNAGASSGGAAPKPEQPKRRPSDAPARRERANQEAERRAEEDTAEDATRAEEDARLNKAKTPKERAALRREIAQARRERAAARRAARRERQAAERNTRTQEDTARDDDREQRAQEREQERAERQAKPKKGGGGKGGGGDDPAKAAAQQQREQERQARQAEQAQRRQDADARREQRDQERRAQQAAVDARRDAADQRREQATAARLEREARALTDLAQQAQAGQKLTSAQWQRLAVQGMAQRTATGGALTDAGRRQARRQPSPFSVFKDASGQWRWIAVSSTAFQDRDREIVTVKALADDCAHADATGEYGPLRWWHCPGVDIGECDYNAVSGRSLIEMGTFRDEALARAAAKAAPDLELSIGFRHLPHEPGPDGAYTFIRRFERSLVPRGRAANPFTAFAVTTKEDHVTPEKLKAALEKLGSSPEARALMQTIIAQAQTREKEAEAAGIAYKEAPAEIVVGGVAYTLKAVDEKAAMDPAEMIEAGTTEADDGMAEEEAEADDDGALLTEAEVTMIADRVAQALMGQLDGIAAKMAAVDEELKGRGYQKMKEATESLPAALATLASTVKEIQTTVNELAGLAPGKGYRPSDDNPDLEALIESALKADGDELDPADPLASVMKFLRPAA